MPGYQKIWFSSKLGRTAGLVIERDKVLASRIDEMSKMFPMNEARFMRWFNGSPVFDTWDEAFNFKHREVANCGD